MIQIALLLLGVEAIQRHWLTLATIGAIWGALGFGITIDPLDGVQNVTMHVLGLMLVIEGAVTLLAGVLSDTPRPIWIWKAAALVAPGLLIIDTPFRNVVLISILFGFALLIDGAVRIASTLVVRYRGWKFALIGCAIEITLAILAFLPWPITYEATVPFCVGIAMMLSSWAVIRSALILRSLPPGAPITSLPIFEHRRGWHAPAQAGMEPAAVVKGTEPRMVVHVWTPLASSASPVRRPVMDRYVAAIDRQGAVSTGHAALEMPPDLYISHYGTADQEDRTSTEFRAALHAGTQNDVTGRFLPSYAAESADWCESTAQVVFRKFSASRLAAFWERYQRDPTYNLTNRNCSVAVALALDAALEGALGNAVVWPPFLRLVIHPDLYLATVLRKRAQTMTWTPGLVLDYARALHHVVEPPTTNWIELLRQTRRRWRGGS